MDKYANQLDSKVNDQLKETKFALLHGDSKKKPIEKQYDSDIHQEDFKIDNYYGEDEDERHSPQKKQQQQQPQKQKQAKRSPHRKSWKDTDVDDTDVDRQQYSKIKNSNTFQKYLQNEASQQEKLKQSQVYEDDKRQDYEDEGRGSSARRGGARQTFGEKVQRFNKAIVGNDDEDEEQFYQNQYPPNMGYDQKSHQTPQNMYQNQLGPMMPRFSQPNNSYNPPQSLPGERELAGYSEQILSSQGLTPSYLAQQQMYNQNFMNNTSQEGFNMKPYQLDPKQSMYMPNMASSNFQPGQLYPQQFQNTQAFNPNAFGINQPNINDPNMSMYAPSQRQQEPNIDAYSSNQKAENEFISDKLTKVQSLYGMVFLKTLQTDYLYVNFTIPSNLLST